MCLLIDVTCEWYKLTGPVSPVVSRVIDGLSTREMCHGIVHMEMNTLEVAGTMVWVENVNSHNKIAALRGV